MTTINDHLPHLEDLVFLRGYPGVQQVIRILRILKRVLGGVDTMAWLQEDGLASIGVKWDGSPSIVAGIDPTDGAFFVAKKSIFNKTPKVYKSPDEIQKDTTGDLALKLSVAFEQLKPIVPKTGIFQGDIMFTRDDLKFQTINGTPYITFHPNTIMYGVSPAQVPTSIVGRSLGIVWHTEYTGEIGHLEAHYGSNIAGRWRWSPDVWMTNASIPIGKCSGCLSDKDSTRIESSLGSIGQSLHSVDPGVFNVAKVDGLLPLLLSFENSLVRRKEYLSHHHLKEFRTYVQNEICGASYTVRSRDKFEIIMDYFDYWGNRQIGSMIQMVSEIAWTKNLIISRLDVRLPSEVSTFLCTKDGVEETTHEGYVITDKVTSTTVKLVNRLQFSHANFDPEVIKGWQHTK